MKPLFIYANVTAEILKKLISINSIQVIPSLAVALRIKSKI